MSQRWLILHQPRHQSFLERLQSIIAAHVLAQYQLHSEEEVNTELRVIPVG